LHYFTSITANYLPKARALANSVKRHNPGSVFHLVLCDRLPESVNVDDEPFDSIVFVTDLDIPDLDAWIFKHSVVELCTAVKGRAFLKLFELTSADKLIYFDPDIIVLNVLEDLEKLLDRHAVVLTPHQVEPDTGHQAILDNEICSLKHGIYNLGFLAVRHEEDGLRFLQWWCDRLLHYCYDDIPNGLFTDQRWIDLAPAFFDAVHILRDKTYNVATWNLSHRPVASDNGKLLIHGKPIKFFHFSGFDSGAQEIMLKRYAGGNQALFDFRQWYIEELDAMGQAAFGKMPCIYGFYSNGHPIAGSHRSLYRSRQDLIAAFPQPFRDDSPKTSYYRWLDHRRLLSEPAFISDQEVRDIQHHLTVVLNSWSWRLTRPLRRLKRTLGHVVQRQAKSSK
jgi:hypothetical protein